MKYLLGKSFKMYYGGSDYNDGYDAIDWSDYREDEGDMPVKKVRIVRNAARCKRCGDVIASGHVHAYVTCGCGAIAVDGGLEYLKRCGDPADMEDLAEVVAEPAK